MQQCNNIILIFLSFFSSAARGLSVGKAKMERKAKAERS
jgi:hypothetical protein